MFAQQSGRPFQHVHVSSAQWALPPVTDDILPALLVRGFSRGSSLPPGRVHYHTLPSSTASLAQPSESFSVDDATRQKSSSAHLGSRMHAQQQQPLTDYPMSWPWTPTQLHARLTTPTAAAMAQQNVHPSDKSQRLGVPVPGSHHSSSVSVAGPSNAMAVPLTYDDPLIRVRVPPPPATSEPSYPAAHAPSTLPRLPEPTAPAGRAIGSFAREKKHGCWMCHKSFDRPSTLRKVSYHQTLDMPLAWELTDSRIAQHLLVHTGERGLCVSPMRLPSAAQSFAPAHVCETCGRRFGVASNLNRHVKRCLQRPIHSAAGSSAKLEQVDAASAAVEHEDAPPPNHTTPPQHQEQEGRSITPPERPADTHTPSSRPTTSVGAVPLAPNPPAPNSSNLTTTTTTTTVKSPTKTTKRSRPQSSSPPVSSPGRSPPSSDPRRKQSTSRPRPRPRPRHHRRAPRRHPKRQNPRPTGSPNAVVAHPRRPTGYLYPSSPLISTRSSSTGRRWCPSRPSRRPRRRSGIRSTKTSARRRTASIGRASCPDPVFPSASGGRTLGTWATTEVISWADSHWSDGAP